MDLKQKEIEETTLKTVLALEKIVDVKLSACQPKYITTAPPKCRGIKYKPSNSLAEFNSGAKEINIRMFDLPVDPLDPPKFLHKKIPTASGSDMVPVLQSPPRPVTVKEQKDWNIPSCISNWKNAKGYTIPLDKRLAADGSGVEEVRISDKFPMLSEALCETEKKAREVVNMRAKVRKEMMLLEKKRKEEELCALAKKARLELGDCVGMGENVERLEREKVREERRRERRLEEKEGKRRKVTRDGDRDISEKVALGMAFGGKGDGVMYDTRLFNQEKGMDSRFATDDQYNVYDNRLFTAQNTLSTLYRPKKDVNVDSDVYGYADEQLDKITKTNRFKPDKSFGGISVRSGPAEIEKETDPFGLDQFLTEIQKRKKAMEMVGGSSIVRSGSISPMLDGYGSGSSHSTPVLA